MLPKEKIFLNKTINIKFREVQEKIIICEKEIQKRLDSSELTQAYVEHELEETYIWMTLHDLVKQNTISEEEFNHFINLIMIKGVMEHRERELTPILEILTNISTSMCEFYTV